MIETLKFDCKVDNKSTILRELKVTVDPSSFQGYIDTSLSRLQQTAQIRGFRKGKVPLDLIKKYYLKDVKADVVKQVVSDSFWKAVRDQNILPVGAPLISDIQNPDLEDAKKLTYVANVEVFPEIKLANLGKVKVQRHTAVLGADEVEKTIENLRQNHAEVTSSEGDSSYERAVTDGDTVEMTFLGRLNGQTHDKLKGERQVVKVGAKRFLDELEEALVGMRPGQTKSVTVTFSQEFPDEMVAGKPVEFEVTLHEIKKVQLPALDDEFAKRFQSESIADLREKVQKSLSEEKTNDARSRTRESLMRGLLEHHSFEVPTALVDTELKSMVDDFANRMRKQGFTDKMLQAEVDRRTAEMRGSAVERVRVFLLLEKVAEQAKLEVIDADLDREYEGLAKNISSTLEQVREFYGRSEDALRRLKYRLKEEKVIEYLMGQVKVEEA